MMLYFPLLAVVVTSQSRALIIAVQFHCIGVSRVCNRERAAIGHDILHGLDIRIIYCRIIDIAENTVCNRKPDLGGRITRCTEAILP